MANKQVNVLVTGIGAIIGYGIIKSIRSSGIDAHIVGMDIYEDAVGQHWCDEFIQAKYAVDPEYIPFVKEIIRTREIDIMFFGTEQEIYKINACREEMGEDMNKIVINRSELLELSKDKWLTREYMINHGLEEYAIPSVIEGNYQEIAQLYGKEFLLKPRSSYASKGIVKVSDEDEFNFYAPRMGKGFMAQMLIGDVEHEYTVSVFGLGNGEYSSSIALRRKLSQEGATAKAYTVNDPQLDEATRKLCAQFKPVGPTNLQFRYHDGKYLLLEINPRISSATSIRMALGYNEAAMAIKYFIHGEKPVSDVKTGRAVRFIDEVVIVDK